MAHAEIAVFDIEVVNGFEVALGNLLAHWEMIEDPDDIIDIMDYYVEMLEDKRFAELNV